MLPGLSFLPAGQGDQGATDPSKAGQQPVQEAIKIISARIPRRPSFALGGAPIAPAPLLQSQGAAGAAPGLSSPVAASNPLIQQAIAQMSGIAMPQGAAPTPAPAPSAPPRAAAPMFSPPPPPRIVPGVQEGERPQIAAEPQRAEPEPGPMGPPKPPGNFWNPTGPPIITGDPNMWESTPRLGGFNRFGR